MEIVIERDSEILAHHTTESCLSHYGQAVWIVEDDNPEPGAAIWRQGETAVPLDIIKTQGGWLICKQPDGLLCGIIWSDGSYHADLIVDANDQPAKEMKAGVHVRNTIHFDADDSDDLGVIFT